MLQLNQLGNPEDEKNIPDIYHWAQLFKAKTWEKIQMLAQKNDVIQQSVHPLQELTADEEMQTIMEARDRFHKDFAAALDYHNKEMRKQLDALQAENAKKSQDILALQEEIAEFKERFRVLEEQIAKSQKE